MIDVIIVGLGRIGAGNIGLSGDLPLSHLAAVQAIPEFSVAGLVDPDPQMRAAVSLRYPDIDATRIVPDLAELPRAAGGVISICVPPSARREVVDQALLRKPRVMVLEKPISNSLIEAQRIVDEAEQAQVALRVNFHRRFDPRHKHWQSEAPANPRAIVMRYGKGLMNYASHLVDLLLDWYGPVKEVQAFSGGESAAADPAVSFRCRMAAGFDAIVIGIEGLSYDQFEIDIFGANECVKLGAGGADIRRYQPAKDLYYRGYSHLSAVDADRDLGPVGGFVEMYAAIVSHLRDGLPLSGCDGRAALAGMAVLAAAQRSAAAGGTAVSPEPV